MTPLRARLKLSNQKDLLIPAAYITGAFILGMIWGSSVLHTLNPAQQDELRQYLESFLSGVGASAQHGQFPSIKAWSEVLRTQLYTLGMLWLLGLSAVGAPLIILLVGARGFVLGFTVGFLVQEKAAQGLLLALVAVLPQNLCYIPGLLGAGTLAFYFSLYLWKNAREVPLFTGMLFYSLIFLAILLLIFVGSWIEAYLVPGIMRLTMFLA